jgi:dTDP-4-dehydrorhamnose 3,5-epimerase
MKVHATPLAGLWEIETTPHGDSRGRFTRIFCTDELIGIAAPLRFVQTNLSRTERRGTVRGLHFQRAPALESKLIRCLRGRVFDVAVDLRAGSESYGRWFGLELSQDNERQIFIPGGFAHGFQTLSDDVELLYQHTAPHAPDCEGGLHFSDPALAIDWPLPVSLVSARDNGHPLLDRHFEPLRT